MTWLDRYLPASFRGIPFKVASHGANLGKRTQSHEFIGRDGHYLEEFGRKAGAFKVEAYIVGDDYDLGRTDLISACLKAGPGELVHPYLGVLQVSCLGINVKETSTETRIARFTISFTEAGENLYPDPTVDPVNDLAETAELGKDAVGASFAEQFTVEGFPDFVADTATAQALEAVDAIENATSFLFGATEALSDLATELETIRDNIDDLIKLPSDLANSFRSAIDRLAIATGNDVEAFRATFGLTTFGDGRTAVNETTTSRAQQGDNQRAQDRLIKTLALNTSAFQAGTIDYDSHNDAIDVSNLLAQAIDDCQEQAPTDAEYQSLQELRRSVVDAVPPDNRDLPTIREITPPSTLPAIVIAYALYQNANQDADIIGRNNIAHPGFIPGGEPLEVLSNA